MSQSKGEIGSKAKTAKAKAQSVKASGAKVTGATAVAAAAQPKSAATVRVIPAPQPAAMPQSSLTPDEKSRSAIATELAADIERALQTGERPVVIDPQAVQDLIAALCKVYSAHVDLELRYDAFSTASPVRPTDVMVTASGLLKAANLAVFELGMWQSWSGR